MSEHIRFRIKIGDNELEIEADKEFIDEKYLDFKNLIKNHYSKTISVKEPIIDTVKRKITLLEYIKSKNPKSYQETALVIARWHEIQTGTIGSKINTNDLIEGFPREKPKNPSDVLLKCVRNAWFVQSGQKNGLKAYKLTSTGLDIVETM
ncbi:MAG: hypothetical protein ACTSYH_06015 [Candidatus Heimdallarchaeaceae archaeon]